MQTVLIVLLAWAVLAALAVTSAAALLAGSKRWERSARATARRQADEVAVPQLRRAA